MIFLCLSIALVNLISIRRGNLRVGIGEAVGPKEVGMFEAEDIGWAAGLGIWLLVLFAIRVTNPW